MKKTCSRVLLRSGLLAVCAGFVMIACSKEETQGSWNTEALNETSLVEDEPQLPEEEWVEASLASAIRQDAEGDTKTQMGGASGRSVLWSDNDEIGIFDTRYKGAGSRFSGAQAGPEDKSRLFAGRIREHTSSFFSVYPYQEDASLNGTVLTMQIPTRQEAVNGSFGTGAALAFASGAFNEERGTDESVTFTNLCAILCFKMPAYIDGAKSVVVRAKSGAAIAGTVTIDCTRAVITSVSGSSSVTVSSDAMAASGAYYVAIAPGTYENGFSFTVTTAGGSTYMAQTTKTLPAQAGVIYNLGTVNLNLNTAPTVTIVHQYNASGELSGSSAALDVPEVSKELENLITAWEATLSKNGTVCRRLNRSAGTMTTVDGWPYLPQGSYDISVRYTLVDGKVKTLTGTATSPAPTINVTVGGYSSYDEYAGKNGRSGGATEANKLDAETVYALSAKINVTSELIANAHYSKSLSYSYDGSATTFSGNSVSIGNKTGQSWAKHTLTASCTFDGVTGNASREFHITGLPYRVSPPTNSGSHPWSAMEGRITWESNRVDLFYSAANYPRIGSPTFYIPADINVNMSTKVVKNNSGLNGPLRITLQDDNHKLYDSTLKKNATYESTISTTMTTSLKQFRIQYRYMASGPHTYVYYFNVLYR